MKTNPFFAEPPKAECAFLSACTSEKLIGRCGIRIDMEPLSFADPDVPRELEPYITLECLSLPSIIPAELANTRFSPATDEPPDIRYEGSFYFLGEHNWVDLREIRFLDATGGSILTEYDLVIHLPKHPPNEYSITLKVQTKVGTGQSDLEPPRTVAGIGTLVQSKKDFWLCDGIYNGRPVQIEFSANAASFEEIAAYAHSVIARDAMTRSKMDEAIRDGLRFLVTKFKRCRVSPDFKAEDFAPRSFYFYKRRHHQDPEMIIVLGHPSDPGHWSLQFTGTGNGALNWVPKS
ncbi:MAG: hypothetical protein HQ567_04435 [Candidatus Nealsonbacteria bacterium]|nr:hypothetical protein [Candidatus Nealsonbacteria bacterium]